MRWINNGDDAVSNESILYINGVQKQPPVNWRWRYTIKKWVTTTKLLLAYLYIWGPKPFKRFWSFAFSLFHPPPLCSLLCCNNLPYFSMVGWGTTINTSVVDTKMIRAVSGEEYYSQTAEYWFTESVTGHARYILGRRGGRMHQRPKFGKWLQQRHQFL